MLTHWQMAFETHVQIKPAKSITQCKQLTMQVVTQRGKWQPF